jgi:hypothetical protein
MVVRIRRTLWKEHYCSFTCVRTGRVSNIKGNVSFLQSDNRKDKYTGLREHLRPKNEVKEVSIDLVYLLEIWEKKNKNYLSISPLV